METVVKKLYEAMFLVDSARAASDWDGVNATIKSVLERAGAEIVSIRKWDERRLAYDIKGKSRGTYILCYFRVDGEKVRDIERDVQLSDRIMRVLILSTEAMTQEDIEKETPATRADKHGQQAAHVPAKSGETDQLSEEKVAEPEQSSQAVEILESEQAEDLKKAQSRQDEADLEVSS